MIFINIIFYAICSRILGGMFTKPGTDENAVSRWVTLFAIFAVTALQMPDLWMLAAYLWLFYVLRLMPNNTLLSAVNGKYPARDDKNMLDWLQNAAIFIDGMIIDRTQSLARYYSLGIVYGALRFCLSIPAVIFIGNPWLVVFFGLGAIYYLVAAVRRKMGLRNETCAYQELIVGGLYGAFI